MNVYLRSIKATALKSSRLGSVMADLTSYQPTWILRDLQSSAGAGGLTCNLDRVGCLARNALPPSRFRNGQIRYGNPLKVGSILYSLRWCGGALTFSSTTLETTSHRPGCGWWTTSRGQWSLGLPPRNQTKTVGHRQAVTTSSLPRQRARGRKSALPQQEVRRHVGNVAGNTFLVRCILKSIYMLKHCYQCINSLTAID